VLARSGRRNAGAAREVIQAQWLPIGERAKHGGAALVAGERRDARKSQCGDMTLHWRTSCFAPFDNRQEAAVSRKMSLRRL